MAQDAGVAPAGQVSVVLVDPEFEPQLDPKKKTFQDRVIKTYRVTNNPCPMKFHTL